MSSERSTQSLLEDLSQSRQQTLLSWDHITWAWYLSYFHWFIPFNNQTFGIHTKESFCLGRFVFKTSYFVANADA